MVTRWGRFVRRSLFFLSLFVFCLSGVVVPYVAAAAPDASPDTAKPAPEAQNSVGPKSYYLALGDSLAFGYQPNFDLDHGYAQQWYRTDLLWKGSWSYTNYGCNKESTTTFINGGCPYAYLLHDYYAGSQLNAALNFIKAHPGQVSPVTLDIGADDLLPDIQLSDTTCQVSSNWSRDLSKMDRNLQYILQRLTAALTVNGVRTGDLVIMNLYNPYQNEPSCIQLGVDTDRYVRQVNQVIARDAGRFNVPVADVYTAFGSGVSGENLNLCSYTWMCTPKHDAHASGGQLLEPGNGYGVIKDAFRAAVGY